LYQGPATAVWLGRIVGSEAPVAIKRATDPADPATAARLAAEAGGAGRVDHPNLLRPLRLVDDPPGVAIVYPFVAGGSLRTLLDQRGALSAGEVVALLEPVVAALAARGRPHGDLKPDNVLLHLDGTPVVADAAPTAGATPAYLAPELDPGTDPTVGGDVYALGVLAYEALSGRRPHRGEFAEVRALAAAGAHRRLTTWPGIDRPVAEAVEAALSIDPSRRPATPGRFVAALAAPVDPASVRRARPVRAEAPTFARPGDATVDFGPGPPPPATHAPPRRRAPVVAAAVGALVVVGAAVWGPVRPSTGCPAHDVADPGDDVVAVDLDGHGCDDPARWDGEVLTPLDPSSPAPPRRVGGPGTQVRFGDWDGDGATTVAAYEPALGVIRYLDRLDEPDVERREPAPRGGRVVVVAGEAGDRLVVRRR